MSDLGAAAFTGTRVARLINTLRHLGPVTEPLASGGLLPLWRAVGGPVEEIGELLRILDLLGLIRSPDRRVFSRTASGSKVAKAAARGDLSPFALAVIRSGLMHDQIRMLLESGVVRDDGSFECPTRFVRARCAQMYGLLRMWSDVAVSASVRIPRHLLDEMTQIWALVPPPADQEYLVDKKKVGDRAELYTVNLERSRARDPAHIAWISRDSDSFGYDIEDRATMPPRCIEVKGRRDDTVTFFMTDNELGKARAVGARYEIHFWGLIDLNRDAAEEYVALRSAGYPIIFSDIARLIEEHSVIATAVKWKITVRR